MMTRRKSIGSVAIAILALLAVAESSSAANPPATWTTGVKKVLVIPVKFSDFAGPSDVPGPNGYLSGWGNVTNGTTLTALTNFYARQTYGKVMLQFTVLPEIDMGVSYTIYTNRLYPSNSLSKFTLWSDPGSFADDVRAKARQVGTNVGNAALYDTDNYDLDIVATGFIPGEGTLSAGVPHGKGIYGNSFKVWGHELGHNFGLHHGNGISRATGYGPQTNGIFFIDTYGDVYDLMGFKYTVPVPNPADHDANVYWKNQLGWLTDDYVTNPVTAGTCRIYAFDQPNLEAGKYYAMKIVRDQAHTYWFDYRQAGTNYGNPWSTNGLEVHFGGDPYPASSGHTTLIDMTPGSRGLVGTNYYATMFDAPLAIGRTYTDAEINLSITPIKKGGTTPESLDVVVNYGPFAGNSAPTISILPTNVTLSAGVAQTFTTTASDPDGDTLTYYWEFDNPDQLGGTAIGGNNADSRLATQGSHTWMRNGDNLVRCTVSDMKGHTASAAAKVTITNGPPAILTISGIVKDENGHPLAGAIVNNYKSGSVLYGSTDFAGSSETAADGRYIVQLPAIGAHTYTLSVMYQGYAFTCSAAGGNVFVSSASVANITFTRVRANRKISGGIYVAGRPYDPATDGALTVSVAGITTNASYGGWQTTVPDGTLANLVVTPSNPNYGVSNYSPNPFTVVNDLNTLNLFVHIPNRMPEVGFPWSGTNSDDTAGTVNIPVTMALPAGSNSWVTTQYVYYWIDPSSTAEYGVDYRMAGGQFVFYPNIAPTPLLIPLKIIHNGVPKNRTIVIQLGVGSFFANLSATNTFTYTITNPFAPITLTTSNQQLTLTWPSTPAARYTIESTHSLNPAVWTNFPPFTNLTGDPGTMMRSLPIGNATNEFFRVKVE